MYICKELTIHNLGNSLGIAELGGDGDLVERGVHVGLHLLDVAIELSDHQKGLCARRRVRHRLETTLI